MVDDDITNLTVARNNLSDKYDIFTAPSGERLFALLKRVVPDLILLDVDMPEMNGYEVIKLLKAMPDIAHIPVIFLTSKIDPENEMEGLSLGAVDYITKPFSKELLIKRIDLHILLEKQKKDLLDYSMNLEEEVAKKTQTIFELQNTLLSALAELVESRDNITGWHIERTQHYLRMLLNYLILNDVYSEEISSWDMDLLLMSSQLHDVGKIAIKDSILMKPGPLTGDEFAEMKRHAGFGVDIIKKIEKKSSENAFLHYAEIFAGTHHEKWDGSGYPQGLKGTEIPLQGRLMAIVDVYDALTNDRPYKKKFSHKESLDIIAEGSGKHFDPNIVEVFLMYEKQFEAVSLDKSYE